MTIHWPNESHVQKERHEALFSRLFLVRIVPKSQRCLKKCVSGYIFGQFLTDTAWGDLDVLVVDTPPGTSDEHIAVMENLKVLPKSVLEGAVLVTTPQALAVGDVRRELTFCKKANLKVLGTLSLFF